MHMPRRTLLFAGAGLPLTLTLGCTPTDRAPASTFVLLDGSTLSTADLAGKVTLVNFWATTCVACVRKMPAMVDTYQRYQAQGFETIAVAMKYDPPDWVANFATSRRLPFKVALDNTGQIARDWNEVRLTPTTFIVDKRLRIVKRYLGEPDAAAVNQLIERLLVQG